MAFKPKTSGKTGGGTFEPGNYPEPRAGLQKARVSLIIDLGEQERDDFEDKTTGEVRPQEPCDQVAVFVDLVNNVVDYGGKIGEQQYRLLINNTFKGDFKGINFLAVPQKDADGNILKDKDGKWLPLVLHPASPLTKIAKASGNDSVVKSMDIEQLLNAALMVDVEVKKTEDKQGRLDKDGKVIVFTNVNYKGCAKVPADDDGVPQTVKPLNVTPKCITFDNAQKEDIQVIRRNLIAKIKLAKNYAGSKMQKAIEAFEAENPEATPSQGDSEPSSPAPAPAKAKRTPAPPPKPTTGFDDMDDDIPF